MLPLSPTELKIKIISHQLAQRALTRMTRMFPHSTKHRILINIHPSLHQPVSSDLIQRRHCFRGFVETAWRLYFVAPSEDDPKGMMLRRRTPQEGSARRILQIIRGTGTANGMLLHIPVAS